MVLLHGHLLKLKDLIKIYYLWNTFSCEIFSNIQKAINEQNHSTTKMMKSHEISTFLKFGIVKLFGNLCIASLKSLWSEHVAWQQMEVFTLWRGHFHQNAMYNTILVGNIGNCLNYVWVKATWSSFLLFHTFGKVSGRQIPASDKYPDRSASSKVMFFILPLVLWYFMVMTWIKGNCRSAAKKTLLNMCPKRSVWILKLFLQRESSMMHTASSLQKPATRCQHWDEPSSEQVWTGLQSWPPDVTSRESWGHVRVGPCKGRGP